MRAALPWPPESAIVGAPPTYYDMERAAKKEVPIQIPGRATLPGFDLRVHGGFPNTVASRTSSLLLWAVLHSCLAKKLPVWLVRNSRPRHVGALPAAAEEGRRAGPLGNLPGAQARRGPGTFRLSAANVGPHNGPGLLLAVGPMGNPAWGGVVGGLG